MEGKEVKCEHLRGRSGVRRNKIKIIMLIKIWKGEFKNSGSEEKFQARKAGW